MATFSISPLGGINIDRVDSEQKFALGTQVDLSDGGKARYVQAASIISSFNAVSLHVNHTAENLTTTSATVSKEVGFADALSVPLSSFFWVRLSGRPRVKMATDCADQVILFTTGTVGVLDDATISASLVAGVTSKTTISNATAVTCIVPRGAYIHPFANPA